MNIIKKQVAEKLTFDIDFSAVIGENTIASASTIIKTTTGTTTTSTMYDSYEIQGNKVLITIKAGTVNTQYIITVTTVLSNSDIIEDDFLLDIYENYNILNDVKKTLQITSNYYDDEINDIISAAKADLVLTGVGSDKINDNDILIKRAIILFAKASFGLDNQYAEKFLAAYNTLKAHLSISQEYRGDT